MHYAAKLMLLCATPSADKGFITNFQAKQLPYLQAIVRESLRISPPVVGLFPRDVLPEGNTVVLYGKPTFLPGGTSIGRAVSAMYRCKEIYGKDADTFRLERWLKSDPAKLAVMNRTNELIFNYGKFQCLGRAIAQTEIGKTVFEVC
ncbi:cytochrome p450 domain-containing protein [Hirsutella rhossiliensis]|uniref:Cytochrome p450 domain-containing protein n=1 Tax=Hirsutella rhossiliensis TaxID=111463 RepID=A0A9P8SL52_9HYPO|nr:cytochrome p450 domain-containing protein [Hirsutella rhossiliensis]KAH0966601.1 cytochrome p450 domain-containing protein [Hirsutella rhossiliensis]